MNKCTLLGHEWDETEEGFIYPSTWVCGRCGVETDGYLEPPRWPWFFGYPMESP